jgi:hypothetical protein
MGSAAESRGCDCDRCRVPETPEDLQAAWDLLRRDEALFWEQVRRLGYRTRVAHAQRITGLSRASVYRRIAHSKRGC